MHEAASVYSGDTKANGGVRRRQTEEFRGVVMEHLPDGRGAGLAGTFADADVIRVGVIDLQDGDKQTELGTTRAWNWQQGCMLKWIPGRPHEVIWNDREGDRFVARICDVRTRAIRTLPAPIYNLSPDGRTGIAPDFRRLNDTYPDPQRRLQTPCLYHPATRRRITRRRFFSPAAYVGEWRCDLHPRASRDGKFVCIDSTHATGRQMHLINLRGLDLA